MSNALSRRTVLARTLYGTVAASALSVGGGGPTAVHAQVASLAPVGGKPRRFEVGTVTYNLGAKMKLDDLIANCEKGGFKAVELRTTHAHGVEPAMTAAERKAVRERFTKTPVKLFGLGSTCEFHSEKAGVVKQNIETCRAFIELCADVGAVGVKVRPNGLPKSVPVEATLKQIGHALQEVGQYAEKHKVEIHVEVHGGGTSHPPHMKTMLDTCDHPAVGITWNSNDSDKNKEGSITEHFHMLAKYIRNVHMRDLFVNYPFRELFSLLKSIGYDRFCLAEIPESSDPVRVMRYYRRLWDEFSG